MPQLDALRGIAALIVVVSHCANAGLIPSALGQGLGQMGVGIFYILSAFLLTTLYTDAAPDKTSIHDYLVRRAARVLPLFYAALFASFAIEILTGISFYGAFDTSTTALGNILLIQGTSVLWSIPVEIQFYLLFLVFWRLLSLGATIAFGYLVALQIGLIVVAEQNDFSHMSLPFWLHFFTFGCAMAVAAKDPNLRARLANSRPLKLLCYLGIIGTGFALPGVRREYLDLATLKHFVDPVTVSWIVLFSMAFIFGQIPGKWLDVAVFRFLGAVSFSVYLLHIAIIISLTNFADSDLVLPYDRFVIVLIATYGLAGAVHRFFERPAQARMLSVLLPAKMAGVRRKGG